MTLTRCTLLLAAIAMVTEALPTSLKRNATTDHEDFVKILKEKLSKRNADLLKKRLTDGDLEKRFLTLRNSGSSYQVPSLTAEKSQEVQKILQVSPISKEASKPAADDIFEQNRQKGIAEFLLKGDIYPSHEQLDEMIADSTSPTRTKRSAAKEYERWTDGVVYYELTPEIKINAGKIQMIQSALQYIQKRTCVKFEESTMAENRTQLTNNAGCFSMFGMQGGVQPLALDDGCGERFGTIVHEFMHALGFFHTQSRDDRDSWVTVIPENIIHPDYISGNFAKRETFPYTPYDYGSVMHYRPTAFAKAGKLSIVPKWPNQMFTMGSDIVTFYDMKMINDYYECHAKCPVGSAPCANGGYPNPNNCAECVCPPGYGGGWCMRQPEGCFAQLTATTAWKTQFIQIGHNNNAPAKTQIQVKMTAINYAKCEYGCRTNGFEIKLNDQKQSGIRVCCAPDLNKVYAGSLNPMPIISHNRQGYTSYYIQYRYVNLSG